MAPRLRRNEEQPVEPLPASEDPPLVAVRTRRAGHSNPPAPPALTTAQNASSGEPDRGFAGLRSAHSNPASFRQNSRPNWPVDWGRRSRADSSDAISTANHSVSYGSELASRLAQLTAMASLGLPVRDRLHANSDVEDSSEPDSDEFPVTVHQRAPRVPALRTGLDSDDETAPPSAAPGQPSTGLQKLRLVFSLQHVALVAVVRHPLRILKRTLALLAMTTAFLLTLPRC
ncbi:hypothetical protein B0H10DRAFT_1942649 [Mycena sp. CBHHK59/15]|nr:hypothetical protein B0H10DRAFT_1942649 [Mycena sp. CBHHK59/15]